MKKPASKNQEKKKAKSEDLERVMKKPAAKKDSHDRDELFKGDKTDDASDGSGSREHEDAVDETKKKPAAMKGPNLSFFLCAKSDPFVICHLLS